MNVRSSDFQKRCSAQEFIIILSMWIALKWSTLLDEYIQNSTVQQKGLLKVKMLWLKLAFDIQVAKNKIKKEFAYRH